MSKNQSHRTEKSEKTSIKNKNNSVDLSYLEEKDISVTSFEIKNDKLKEYQNKSNNKLERQESEPDTANSTITGLQKVESSLLSDPEAKPKPSAIDLKALKRTLLEIFNKSGNPQDLIQVLKAYKPISKEMEATLQNRSEAWKVRKYKNAIYYGELINGERFGKGVMLYENNSVYEGDWDTSLKHGKGIEVTTQGAVYEGEYKNGKPEGYGVFTWPNGESYEGLWKCGKKHGSGTWKGIRGESYIGEWVQGRQEGFGIFTWRHGEKYEGNYLNFLKHGHGKETFGNGDYYEGSYLNGKPNGYGEYYWGDGRQYKGFFCNGFRHGKGEWKGGVDNGDTYEGEWANDKKCGSGIYRWRTGNYYKGSYFDDKREGYGEMFWKNGNYYKGDWHKGLMHGEGVLTIPGKDKLSGTFEKGIYLGTKEAIEEENQQQPNMSLDLSDRLDSNNTILPQVRYNNRGRDRNSRFINDGYHANPLLRSVKGNLSTNPDSRNSLQQRIRGLPSLNSVKNSVLNTTFDGYQSKHSALLSRSPQSRSRERFEKKENICQHCKLKQMKETLHNSPDRETDRGDNSHKMTQRPKESTKSQYRASSVENHQNHCNQCGLAIKKKLLDPLNPKMPLVVSGKNEGLTRHEIAKWNVYKNKLQVNPKYYENLDDPVVCDKIRSIINPKVWYPTQTSKVQAGRSIISGHMALFIAPPKDV